jgi:hypothetical protein
MRVGGIGMLDLGSGQGRAGADHLKSHPKNFVVLVEKYPEYIEQCCDAMRSYIEDGTA